MDTTPPHPQPPALKPVPGTLPQHASFPLGGGCTLHITSARGLVALRLERPGRRARTLTLDARPGGPPVAHRWMPWSMRGALWGYSVRAEGPRSLWNSAERILRRHTPAAAAGPLATTARRALTDALQGLSDSLDAALVAETRRFDPAAHWAAYRAMASDATGRIRQLATACPGLFGLALAHARRADRTGARAALRFFEDVVAGTPLRAAAAPLLRDWWDHGARRGRWMVGQGLQPPVDSEEARRGMARQLTLLRRAQASVPLDLLWRPAPLAFAPEDVPTRDTRDQLRWFEMLKSRPVTLFRSEEDPVLQRGMVAWLSRHAQAHIGRASDGVDDLWDWVRGARRQLHRHSNGHEVHNAQVRWHFEHGRHARDGGWDARVRRLAVQYPHLALPQPDGSMDLALPAFLEPYEGPTFSFRPLLRASELKREGEEMGHCVASLLENAAAAKRFLHSLRVGDERLTLELLAPTDDPEPGQFLGRHNREPSPEAIAVLGAWCDALNTEANRPSEEPCSAPGE